MEFTKVNAVSKKNTFPSPLPCKSKNFLDGFKFDAFAILLLLWAHRQFVF